MWGGGGGGGGWGIVFVSETDKAVRSYCNSLTLFLLCNDFEHCSMILSTHYMQVSFPENTVCLLPVDSTLPVSSSTMVNRNFSS